MKLRWKEVVLECSKLDESTMKKMLTSYYEGEADHEIRCMDESDQESEVAILFSQAKWGWCKDRPEFQQKTPFKI